MDSKLDIGISSGYHGPMRKEKYCKRCDQTLPTSQFTKSAGRYDGLQVYCRECMKQYRIEHYNGNKKAYRTRNLKSEARLRQMVLDIKNTGSCLDCGVEYPNEPWLFEFDHRPGTEKSMSISELIKYGSHTRLMNEIDKCDLRCLICHRRKTAKRGGWLDNRLAHLL